MIQENEKHDDGFMHDENKLIVYCPYCGSKTTSPVDRKKMTDEKAIYICLVCGQSFENERKTA